MNQQQEKEKSTSGPISHDTPLPTKEQVGASLDKKRDVVRLSPSEARAVETRAAYLQEKARAEKKFLCETMDVEDDKGKETGSERTICRKPGSGTIVFAWDSKDGDLLKKNKTSPEK